MRFVLLGQSFNIWREFLTSKQLILQKSFVVSLSKNASNYNKGKSDSSTRWLRRQRKDLFVRESVKDNYRCRSAYKLLEIDDKFQFLQPGVSVVDCGASPGSWTQVALQRTKDKRNNLRSIVVAVDLLDIQSIPGAIILDHCDFIEHEVQEKIKQYLPNQKTDIIMSDMAPSATGNKKLDHTRIMDLNHAVLQFCFHILKAGGCFLCKLWDGNEKDDFLQELSTHFLMVKQIKPRASRIDSSELFIFSQGFKLTK